MQWTSVRFYEMGVSSFIIIMAYSNCFRIAKSSNILKLKMLIFLASNFLKKSGILHGFPSTEI